MKVDPLPEQQPVATGSSISDISYCNSSSSCCSAAEDSVRLPSLSSSKTTTSSETKKLNHSSSSSSSSKCEDATTNCNKSAKSSSTESSSSATAPTEPSASAPAAAAATTSSTSSSSVLPLSKCSGSPFSRRYAWLLRISVAYRFIIGGIWGFPAAASVLLLPQQLLRLFTLSGCGLLLLYDIIFGLRRTCHRLLQQQQQEWVQRMLLLLQETEQQDISNVLFNQRKRLQQLVAAVRRCLAAAPTAIDTPGGNPPATTGAAAAASASAVADDAAAAKEEGFIPHETEAAAQIAVGGDMQLAAVVFGAPREVIATACAAAQLLQAETTQQHRLQQKRQTRTKAATAAALCSAAAAGVWGTVKSAVVFVGCVLLVHLFIDIPAAACAAAAVAANIQLSPWWLLLLHAVARGCFAAALVNQHVSSYAGLTLNPFFGRSSNCSSSKKCSSSSGTDVVPKPLNIHIRLFFAFCVPIVCSLLTDAAAAAAAGSAAGVATELQLGWRVLLQLPLGLLQAALQQVLPFEALARLPLQQQRSEAVNVLLLLLQQQRQLSLSMLPEAETLQEYFAAGTLLTAAAATSACCTRPSALWVALMRLDSAAAAAAAAELLGQRALRLKQQPFSERLNSKCKWKAASVLLFFYRLPRDLVSCMRRLFMFTLGLSWLLLLLYTFLNTPLVQRSGDVEGQAPLQTPLQLLQQQLEHQETWEGLQRTWQDVLQMQEEIRVQLKGKTYSEGVEWLLLQLQLSWEEYARNSSKQADELEQARKIFGISEDASAATIKQRYRQLAKLYHPDRAALNSCSSSSNSNSNNSSTGNSSSGIEGSECVCAEGAAEGGQPQCKSPQETMQQINLAYELLLQQAAE